MPRRPGWKLLRAEKSWLWKNEYSKDKILIKKINNNWNVLVFDSNNNILSKKVLNKKTTAIDFVRDNLLN